ncbi:sulfonate transport system substrate-binding protein [Acinetobacter calcoaceticus]|uniref:Sulfonate transport system substrate-binding protein n=1 Tax=Acinetobacter calcoaceticus TaxID=471 RepID=A0A4R1XLK0_ACICA|nr:sulfonate transport system substrate-binding protein [Acinetobacter calcoaceticus]
MFAERKRKYVWAFPILIVVVVLFILLKPSQPTSTLQSGQAQGQEKITTIRIAVPDISSSSHPSSGAALVDHVYLNQMIQKELAPLNVKVEWQFFKGAGPAVNEALANDQVDFAFLGDLAMIIGKSKGIDTRLLMAISRDTPGYLAVLPNKGYNSLAALKGKRIAVFQGTAMQLSFNQFIHQYGFSEKDFRIVNMDPAAANAALAAGQIDAGWGLMNNLALKLKGIVEIPLSSRDSQGAGSIQTGLIATKGFIKTHPEIVQKLVNAVLKSAYYVGQDENRDTAIQLVTQNAGYSKQLYALNLDALSLKDMHSPRLDSSYLDHLQTGVRTALDAKLIKNDIQIKQWIDPQFVDTGIKHLGYVQFWPEK